AGLSFIVSSLTGDFQHAFQAYAVAVMTIVFALASLDMLAPTFSLRRFLRVIFIAKDQEERQERRRIWVDSFIIAGAYITVHMLISTSASWLKSIISPNVPEDYLQDICSVANVLSPTIDLIKDTLTTGFNEMTTVAIMAVLYKKYCKNFW